MNRRMLSKDEEQTEDVQVTREDQDKINTFSTLHQKQSLIEAQVASKRQEKEYLTDVNLELELADEDSLVPYRIGDAFLHLPLEEVQTLLEKNSEDLDAEIEVLEGQMDKNKETMDELKVTLYAKFGKSINLEA